MKSYNEATDKEREGMIKSVKEEILVILQETIENEVDAMGDCYPSPSIAREVLFAFDIEEIKL